VSEGRRSRVPLAGEEALVGVLAGETGDRLVRLAEDLLGEPLEERLRRVPVNLNEAGVDPFGFDPEVARYVLAVAAILHRVYFRTEVFGIEGLPTGRLLLVGNHSGQVPIDGLMVLAALMLDAEPPRFPRSMVERWTAQLPFFSVIFPRAGQVLGSPDNARRLLAQDEALMVFPEGVRGISKTFDRRYQLEPFGHGFMRLALEMNAPIVPFGVVGAEEQMPSVANLRGVARLLGMPALPVLPQLLLGFPLPLPTRYRLHFGTALRFDGDPDDDDALIGEKVEVVRAAVGDLVRQGLAKRRAIFW
jgi:1-acyl-sn-glycerol-3-phosphate acyltransferase